MRATVKLGISRRCCLAGAAALLLLGACERAPDLSAADGTLSSPYLEIGAILAKDELAGVSQLGAAVVEAVAARGDGRGDGPGVAELLAGAGRIGAADISTARLAYRKMSEGMIAHLAANPGERESLQILYCPMAFTNEGAYWVQRGGKLRNPYEGAMMLRCGAKIGWDAHRPGAPPAGEAKLEGMDK